MNGFLHLSHITNPVACEARQFTQYSDRLRLDSRGIVVQLLTDPKHSLFSRSFTLTTVPTQPATRRTSMALHPGHEAYQWYVFRADVKERWIYPSTSTYIHSVDMENYTLPCRTSHVLPVCFWAARPNYPERYKEKQLFWTCFRWDKFWKQL